MLRQWPLRLVLAFLLTSTFVIGIAPAVAQDTSTTESPISPELNAQMDQLVGLTERIRELNTITSVERACPRREETIDYLSRLYDESLPQDQLDRLQAFYVALDLLPADVNLRDVYLSLLGSQVAGFYDTETKLMNVLPIGFASATSLSFSEQIIFVHEYTHALQDQNFNLDSVMSTESSADNPDRALAITALIEGDATQTMNVFAQMVTLQNPMAGLLLLAESLQAGNLTLPAGIPPALVRELLFPYDAGAGFISRLYQEGGWETINRAYTPERLPQTTEQVMHPDKYLSGEQPLSVASIDLVTVLPGWTTDYDIGLGEFYLGEHLRALGLTSGAANTAAAGWGGDRFQLLRDPATGDLAWTLWIAWDTPADQQEFEAAYQDGATELWGTADAQGCWATGRDTRCLTVMSSETVIISAPSAEVAAQIEAGL
ncbi:MAG: hypothetical protein U0670_18310 [Anaerolineae bacterium]